LGKYFQVARNVDIIEMNNLCYQIRVGWMDISIHPAADNIAENFPVQITVDGNHGVVLTKYFLLCLYSRLFPYQSTLKIHY
jgi:hypothetical protein